MARKVELDLFAIFDLVITSQEFDFGHEQLYATLADMAGAVTKEEMMEFADFICRLEGFGFKEGLDALATLTMWQKQYIG